MFVLGAALRPPLYLADGGGRGRQQNHATPSSPRANYGCCCNTNIGGQQHVRNQSPILCSLLRCRRKPQDRTRRSKLLSSPSTALPLSMTMFLTPLPSKSSCKSLFILPQSHLLCVCVTCRALFSAGFLAVAQLN